MEQVHVAAGGRIGGLWWVTLRGGWVGIGTTLDEAIKQALEGHHVIG